MAEYRQNITIKAWSEDDQPREKLLNKGSDQLTDAELIAILLSSGNQEESAVDLGKRILDHVGHDLHDLSRMTIGELMRFKGIGKAKAVSIAAAMELGKRRKENGVPKKVVIRSSNDVYDLLGPRLMDLPYEEFWILLLNRGHQVKNKVNISKGGISGTVADVRLIFKKAVDHLATALILCHNHPSGAVAPSKADIALTEKLVEGGKVLDIPVLDHIIIGDSRYYSFADQGLI